MEGRREERERGREGWIEKGWREGGRDGKGGYHTRLDGLRKERKKKYIERSVPRDSFFVCVSVWV